MTRRTALLSGLVAGDSAICGRLAALILRLRPAGLRFEEFRSAVKTLRAKGKLICEPRFSTPARCDFSHARKGKRPFQRKTLDKGHFPSLAWEKSRLAGGRKSGLTN